MKCPAFALHITCSLILACGIVSATYSLGLADKRITDIEAELLRVHARVALLEHAPGRGR